MFFCCLLIFFKNQRFLKILTGISSECQKVWIQIRPDVLLPAKKAYTDRPDPDQSALFAILPTIL